MMTGRLAAWICLGAAVLGAESTTGQETSRLNTTARNEQDSGITHILGRPTDQSIAMNVLASTDIEFFVEYGASPGEYNLKTAPKNSRAAQPVEIEIGELKSNTHYYYRLRWRQAGTADYLEGTEYSFHTQRPPGNTFVFGLQGDSHPERYGKMYDPDLYVITMNNVSKDQPDFYLTLGDDFSIDRLINRNTLNQANVERVYAHQRPFLGIVGRSSALFLVNGNHEQAARHFLDDTPDNPAVLAGRARTRFYPLPAPDGFYSGDSKRVDFVGLLRDYYAWTWGDALFVVLDPYWHSPVPVDSAAGGGRRRGDSGRRSRDWWRMSIGDAQYQWFKKTLEQSEARYKFVFAHHVLGTGRGGVEMTVLYEWGGRSTDGTWEFGEKRPGWELPIHQLMVKNGVTIFFQGHDHLFARQERDGLVYQATPNPADASYQAYNREAYRSGDILPNSGHLRVTVSPQSVRVDYVRSYLPKDETAERRNGDLAFSYDVGAAAPAGSLPRRGSGVD